MKIAALLRSRRFWATVAGGAVTAAAPAIGLTADQALGVAGLVAAWVIGDSVKNTQ